MNMHDLAARLADARSANSLIEPDLLGTINSTADAYSVQEKAAEAFASKQIGYKVGATNAETQKKFDCDEPFYGPLFESECHASDATVTMPPGLLGGEAEFAFQIGRDLPTDNSLSIEELAKHIAAANVAIELIGRRTGGTGLPPLFAAIADFGGNSGFIKGPTIDNWQAIDLPAVTVTAQTNGTESNRGTGAAVMGHPLNSILWLHSKLLLQGKGLRAGEWISTGTCLGVIAVVPDATVTADFAGCGQVSYRLAPAL